MNFVYEFKLCVLARLPKLLSVRFCVGTSDINGDAAIKAYPHSGLVLRCFHGVFPLFRRLTWCITT